MRKICLLLTLLALGACSKLTLANYDQLKLGMNFQEVSTIIGQPEKCDETLGIRACSWSQGEARVEISFIADQVILLHATQLK